MAAQRFEGRYSPGAARPGTPPAAPSSPAPARPAPARASLRAWAVFAAALPMLAAAMGEIRRGDAAGMAVELAAFALLAAAALLVNEGLRAEAAYAARTVAKPPAIPRKLFGAVAAGLGTALGAAFGWGLGLGSGLAFGLLAGAATAVAFGLDPMRRKGMDGPDAFETLRAAEAVDRAEAMLADMAEAGRRAGDREVEARIAAFAGRAREVFRAVEASPADLAGARKLLGVYLTGARDAARRFADLHARTRDPAARREFEALLGDLEASFAAHRQQMLADDRGALEVEIEVLRKRLRQEGLG